LCELRQLREENRKRKTAPSRIFTGLVDQSRGGPPAGIATLRLRLAVLTVTRVLDESLVAES